MLNMIFTCQVVFSLCNFFNMILFITNNSPCVILTKFYKVQIMHTWINCVGHILQYYHISGGLINIFPCIFSAGTKSCLLW